MTTFPQTEKALNFNAIDRTMRSLMSEVSEQKIAAAKTSQERVENAVKIYAGIKPLLAVLSTLVFLPQSWRKALTLFTQALDVVASGVSGSSAGDFKAGKDL